MRKRLTKAQWETKRRIRQIFIFSMITLFGVMALCLICIFLGSIFNKQEINIFSRTMPTKQVEGLDVTEMLLTPNEYSRPQIPLEKINGIVIHYTANPNSGAKANRNYFESLKDLRNVSASSHFIIGLDGEIIQCIPLDEVAYASNNRNSDTISIECCHPDEKGKFNDATYKTLIQLTAWLCGTYNLKQADILRHYDVTGKDCPRYFVANEDKWEQLKTDVFDYIENNGKKSVKIK